jgi:hypothetical protein
MFPRQRPPQSYEKCRRSRQFLLMLKVGRVACCPKAAAMRAEPLSYWPWVGRCCSWVGCGVSSLTGVQRNSLGLWMVDFGVSTCCSARDDFPGLLAGLLAGSGCTTRDSRLRFARLIQSRVTSTGMRLATLQLRLPCGTPRTGRRPDNPALIVQRWRCRLFPPPPVPGRIGR